MKTLLTILILVVSLTTPACKKKDTKPTQPPPPPPVVCTDKAPSLYGVYYTYNTGSVDSCYLSFIENNCEDKKKWKIDSLSKVFATWATVVDDKVYTIPTSSNRSDSVVMEFKPNNILLISVKATSGNFTPYLSLRKRT